MNFQKVVTSALGPLFDKLIGSIQLHICPDQYVGQISAFDDDQGDFPTRQQVQKRPNNLQCLILVLESPHINEFMEPCGPAKGTTGRNIRRYIPDVMELGKYSNFGMILMNAIQYQCSLGVSTKKYRDQVFRAAWNDSGKVKFQRRLASTFRSGDVLLNCCTKGNGGGVELRTQVQHAIVTVQSNIGCVDIIRRNHPSCWTVKKSRSYEWGGS